MVAAIFHLLTNALYTGCAIVGVGTIINKAGKFFKIVEEEKEDGFRKAFDTTMCESIQDMNQLFDSISMISTNSVKSTILFYEIMVGNKCIQKNKEGKIVIVDGPRVVESYKGKVDELTKKLKKYEEELFKKKKQEANKSKKTKEDVKFEDDSDEEEDDNEPKKKTEIDEILSSDSDEESDEESDSDEHSDEEFYMDSKKTN